MATNGLFQVKGPTNKEIGAVCGCFYYVPGPTGKRLEHVWLHTMFQGPQGNKMEAACGSVRQLRRDVQVRR
jgi:hypothetical protein